MNRVRIHQAGNHQCGQELRLSPEATQHVAVVLRMQVGESLTLFDGNNREYTACIREVKKKEVIVRIDSICEVNRESPLSIHLAQAISKGDRMDLVMQKAVELGVSSIAPIVSQRCVVRLDKERMEKKTHLWQSIAISACEQSGRNTVPVVHSPISFEHYVQHSTAPLKWILDPKATKSWRDFHIGQSIQVLIGPEGGFSPEEIAFALSHGFQSLSLGPRILRTETAAISILSLLQAVGGDL